MNRLIVTERRGLVWTRIEPDEHAQSSALEDLRSALGEASSDYKTACRHFRRFMVRAAIARHGSQRAAAEALGVSYSIVKELSQ